MPRLATQCRPDKPQEQHLAKAMSAQHSPHTKWLLQLRRGAGLTCGGLLLVFASYLLWTRGHQTLALSVFAAAAVCVIVAMHQVRQALARARGVFIERQAQTALRKRLPEDWRMSAGVPVAGLGDADVLLESPENSRFMVEIKSHDGCTVRRSWWGRTNIELRRLDGTRFKADPLGQARFVAAALHATPVVWFPNASKSSVVSIDDTLVVQGGPKVLLKAVGATSSWLPW